MTIFEPELKKQNWLSKDTIHDPSQTAYMVVSGKKNKFTNGYNLKPGNIFRVGRL